MSLFERPTGRRPVHARPELVHLDERCLPSAAPHAALARAALHHPPQVGHMQALREQQRHLNEVRNTLRAAGIPFCFQQKMGRGMLEADFQKALNGTTWRVAGAGRRAHLIEVPPAVTPPPTPTPTPTPHPAIVTLSSPGLATRSATSSSITVGVTAGPTGAPFGVQVRATTLINFLASGGQFPTTGTVTATSGSLAPGQSADVTIPGLDASTNYVVQAVALPGNVANPAPGTIYLQSPPNLIVGITTATPQPTQVTLASPITDVQTFTTTTAVAAVTAGPTGAPFGVRVETTTLADFIAAGFTFPTSGTTTTTLNGPIQPGGTAYADLQGLTPATAYVVRATALGGNVPNPAPGTDYLQSPPGPPALFTTLPVVQAGAPSLALDHAQPHSLNLDLTTGQYGAPGGYVVEFTTKADFLANGWSNAHEVSDVTPIGPGNTVDVHPITGLARDTTYAFRAESEGGNGIITSPWSGTQFFKTDC